MQASRIIEGAPPPPPPLLDSSSARKLLEYQYGEKYQRGHPLSIMAVAGPFTTNDNLDYDPLIDVLMTVLKDAPDVVMLCGPFVDERQPIVGNRSDGPTQRLTRSSAPGCDPWRPRSPRPVGRRSREEPVCPRPRQLRPASVSTSRRLDSGHAEHVLILQVRAVGILINLGRQQILAGLEIRGDVELGGRP